MTTTLAIIGSNPADGANPAEMPLSDRAAIAWALAVDGEALAICAAHDAAAHEFAIAAGAGRVENADEAGRPTFDLAILGEGALLQLGSVLPGVLAERRGATLVFAAIEMRREGEHLVVVRGAPRGGREVWTINGPAVVVVSPDAPRPGYVSRFRRHRARTSLVDRGVAAADRPPVGSAWGAVRPRVRWAPQATAQSAADDRLRDAFGESAAIRGSAGQSIVSADAATCARHLLRYLAHHGFLPGQREGVSFDEPPSRAPQSMRESQPESQQRPAPLPTAPAGALARGPHLAGESPERIARRPRRVDATLPLLVPPATRAHRGPRPAGDSTAAPARRPRPSGGQAIDRVVPPGKD
jgi:electron transfer flavoprotein alpha/beta subunit